MRILSVLLIVAAVWIAAVAAWDEKDHEIFRVTEDLEKVEGKGTTFYSFMGLEKGPSSSLDEITKAYRKKSRQLHPDKMKNPSAEATDRFARLGIIANILRGADKERYDFFLEKGFPRWKGTGYYYSRFRPGLGMVFVFLYLITGLAHYLILSINTKSERARIARHVSECKSQAWPSGFPPADASKRRLQDNVGRVFTVYPDGTVWILDTATGDEYLLDPEEVPDAQWGNTVLARLPKWVWKRTVGRVLPAKADAVEEEVASSAAEPGASKKSRAKKGKAARVSSPAEGEEAEGPAPKKIGDAPKKQLKTKTLADGSVVAEASNVAGGRRRRKK
ncbi:hypothetical protein BZA70DRAFT_276335 [Myxozyma melibiosi]|uniref:J domain-containing protein n=1 Tax=Myxozyma melibiosi TaxID=54550 RepID=A0ABR1F902_9ASCO